MRSRTDCPIFGRWIARAIYHEVDGRLAVWRDEVPVPSDPSALPFGLMIELGGGMDPDHGDFLSVLKILQPWPENAYTHPFLGQYCRTSGRGTAPPREEISVEFTLAIHSSKGRDDLLLPGIEPGAPVYGVLVNGRDWQAELFLAHRGMRMWSSVTLSRHAADREGAIKKVRPAVPGFQMFERLPG